MRQRILKIVVLFIVLSLLMSLQKPIFALVTGGISLTDCLRTMRHGFAMDMSVAGYLTAIPALLMIVSVWASGKWLNAILKVYFIAISIIMATAALANSALYPYWGFPLDTTPIFYIKSSPAAALASADWWVWILGFVFIALLSFLYFLAIAYSWNAIKARKIQSKRRIWATIATAITAAALFLPIRGSLTVSTMNVSRAYFCNDMKLNHAAVNPIFSFLYSAMHSDDFNKQFQYFSPEEAETAFNQLNAPTESADTAKITPVPKANVVLVILEGFSSHLMPTLGGEPIATRLDSIAKGGWLFSNIYSSSFRTDRALPAILCGYPAQPNTSILKYINKLDSLPSIAGSLKDIGYATSYYYGGDINFTNMNALLRANGFDKIVSDKDFPVEKRLSKWGVHDDEIFNKALADIKAQSSESPHFTVIQTSSSHEPFEVPYQSERSNIRANAFAYADHCLGEFVDSISALPSYSNTIVVITPDHLGGYPEEITDPIARHRMPLLITGGALHNLRPDETLLSGIGSQTDIAATILALVGANYDNFRFSHNLLDSQRRPYAFFSEPSFMALVTPDGASVLNTANLESMLEDKEDVSALLKAYVQTLYLDLSSR